MHEARTALAQAQAALVRTLVGNGPPPAGFDAARLAAAKRALFGKRAHELAQTWPELNRDLGPRFAELFAAYAAQTPYPAHGGPLADGRAFVRYLRGRIELSAAARLEVMRVDIDYMAHRDGLVPRRGPVFRAIRLANPRRLLIAWRLPGLGAHWFCLPLSRRLGERVQ